MLEFHLWDLPHDRVYVKLEEGFQKDLFLSAKRKYGSWPKLSKEIKCSNLSLTNWAYSKSFVSLSSLINITKITNTDLETIEKQVTALATGRKTKINGKRGKPIFNPKFPIKLTPELSRVIARFMGDGCIKTNWYYEASYNNTNDVLIEEMKKDVTNVFGSCDIFEGVDTRGNGIKFINFPSIVGMLVVSMVGDVSTTHARIPNQILNGQDDIKSAFLQAYFDDEGTVGLKQPMVRYYTVNQESSKGIMKLLNDLDIKDYLA